MFPYILFLFSILYPNIKVVFLLPDTIFFFFFSLMDQGVITGFKASRLGKTFAQAVAATEEDTERKQLCKDYSMENVVWAWGDVTKKRMNSF